MQNIDEMQDHDWVGFLKAFILNVFAFLFSFTGTEWALRMTLLLVSIAYACWKFRTDYLHNKRNAK